MSGTLSPMIGMGSNGMGAGAGSGIPPQLLALLMQHGGGMGGQMPNAAPTINPAVPLGPTTAPMAQMPAPQQPPSMGQQLAPFLGQNGFLQSLLASMKNGQNGVNPQGGAGGGNGWGWLGNLLRGYQMNGMPGGGLMNNLSKQADANSAGGAPGL